jgi:hypothetical protein
MPKVSGDIRHLWIVLTEPEGQPLEVVIVNLTKNKPLADTTCILSPGDHTFIKVETVVHYADARKVPAEPLHALTKLTSYDFHDDCSEELLERIQRGLLASKSTPKGIKAYCRERFGF